METPSEQVRYGNSAAKKQTHRYFCHTAAIFFFTQLPCREPNIRGAHPLRHLHGRNGHRLLRESRQHDGRVHRLPERKLPHTGQPPQTQHPQGALRALRHGQPEAGNRLRLSGVLDRGPEIRPAARGALFRPLAQNTEVKNRNADAVRSFGHRLFLLVQDAKSVSLSNKSHGHRHGLDWTATPRAASCSSERCKYKVLSSLTLRCNVQYLFTSGTNSFLHVCCVCTVAATC